VHLASNLPRESMHIRHATDALGRNAYFGPLFKPRTFWTKFLEIHRFRGHRSHGRAPVSSLTALHSKPPISSNKLNPGLLQRPLHGVDRGTRDVAARLFKN
jgi:hypothetical protein